MSSFSRYVQLIIAVAGLLAIAGSLLVSLSQARQAGEASFARSLERHREAVEERLSDVRNTLEAVSAVFAASSLVTPAEFTTFVDDFPLDLLGEQGLRKSIIGFGWFPAPGNLTDSSFFKFLANDTRPLELSEDPVETFIRLRDGFAPGHRHALVQSLPIHRLFMASPARVALVRKIDYPWYLRESGEAPESLRGLLFVVFDLGEVFGLPVENDMAAFLKRAEDLPTEEAGLLPEGGGETILEQAVPEREPGPLGREVLVRQAEIEFADSRFLLTYESGPDSRTFSFGPMDYLVPLGLALLTLLLLTYLRALDRQNREMLRAREAAEQAVAVKSSFISTMSHEIRTPMNGVLGMARLLHRSSLDDRQREFLTSLLSSAEALMAIIDDVLDFSKIESGKLSLDPSAVDLAEIVGELGELYAPTAQARGLELVLDLPPEVERRVIADRRRIWQVLSNLLSNALKFTERGHVRLLVREVEHASDARSVTLRFRVEDSGIGIPEEARARIFDRFSQADGSTTRRFGGTGLGLAICRDLAALMGGRISLDSQPGVGSVFTLELRLARSPRGAGPAVGDPALANQRILLVETRAITRRVLSRHIQGIGMECDVAESQEEALRLAKEAASHGMTYSFVFIDCALPEERGRALARALKADGATASSLLVLLMEPGEPGLSGDLTLFSGYLGKPVTVDRLAMLAAGLLLDQRLPRPERPATCAPAAAPIVPGGEDAALAAPLPRPLPAPLPETAREPQLGLRVLLAEDNKLNQLYAETLLTGWGCEVTLADHGQQAIEALERDRFDILFLDWQMPVMDGFEAARIIKARFAEGTLAPLPVVALTANALDGDRKACLEAGMDDYLSKPIEEQKLMSILRKWTGGEARNAGQGHPEGHDVSAREASPCLPSGVEVLVDDRTVSETRALLRDRFDSVLEGYLADTAGYLAELDRAIGEGKLEGLVRPAHTIKSSSQVMGALALSHHAAALESIAKGMSGQGGSAESLRPYVESLRQIFEQTRDGLQRFLKAA